MEISLTSKNYQMKDPPVDFSMKKFLKIILWIDLFHFNFSLNMISIHFS